MANQPGSRYIRRHQQPQRNPPPNPLQRPRVSITAYPAPDASDPYPIDGTFYHPQAISDALAALDPASLQPHHILNLFQTIFDSGFLQGRFGKIPTPHFEVKFDNAALKKQLYGASQQPAADAAPDGGQDGPTV